VVYYHRHGLYCGEYYFYDDYTQITGWLLLPTDLQWRLTF